MPKSCECRNCAREDTYPQHPDSVPATCPHCKGDSNVSDPHSDDHRSSEATAPSGSNETLNTEGANKLPILDGDVPVEILSLVLRKLPYECRKMTKHVCKLLNRLAREIEMVDSKAADTSSMQLSCNTPASRVRRCQLLYFVQNVELLEWACSHGARLSEQTFALAASVGNVEVLQRLFDRQCPWDWTAAAAAADAGNFAALKWLKYNSAPFGIWTCNAAASGGYVEILQWLVYSEGARPSAEACSAAAGNGHTNVLEWLVGYGLEPPFDACVMASGGGHLDCLAWLHHHGSQLHSNCLIAAARGGHLHVLEWLKQQCVAWTEWACSAAAASGHLHILKWLRQQGCPMGASTCKVAARCGYRCILEWTRLSGCPCDICSAGHHIVTQQSSNNEGWHNTGAQHHPSLAVL